MSSKTALLGGLAVCVAAAALMITDVVGVGWGAVVGMVGIGIIGTSAAKAPPSAD